MLDSPQSQGEITGEMEEREERRERWRQRERRRAKEQARARFPNSAREARERETTQRKKNPTLINSTLLNTSPPPLLPPRTHARHRREKGKTHKAKQTRSTSIIFSFEKRYFVLFTSKKNRFLQKKERAAKHSLSRLFFFF